MSIVTTYVFENDNDTVTKTRLNNLVAALITEFNGNIDNSNIKSTAAIEYSKLSLTGSIQKSDLSTSVSSSATASFQNSDLVSGVYTFNHNLGRQYLNITVYDNNGQEITPDNITATDTNNSSIDISSWGTITGTWNIRGCA